MYFTPLAQAIMFERNKGMRSRVRFSKTVQATGWESASNLEQGDYFVFRGHRGLYKVVSTCTDGSITYQEVVGNCVERLNQGVMGMSQNEVKLVDVTFNYCSAQPGVLDIAESDV